MYRNDEQHSDDAPIFSEETLRSEIQEPEQCIVCGTDTDDPVVFVVTMCRPHGLAVSERGMNVSI